MFPKWLQCVFNVDDVYGITTLLYFAEEKKKKSFSSMSDGTSIQQKIKRKRNQQILKHCKITKKKK